MDSVFGVPFSQNTADVLEKFQTELRPGTKVFVQPDVDIFKSMLYEQLTYSLLDCQRKNQKLVLVDCEGYLLDASHKVFDLHSNTHPNLNAHVKGIVEITKQGVWRAANLQAQNKLAVPYLHCSMSELKRIECLRCGETIVKCIDSMFRQHLGLSVAGRHAVVFGAGWIGMSAACALKRLDMIVTIVDIDPVKVFEARMNGFEATSEVTQLIQQKQLQRYDLVLGSTGTTSITEEVLVHLRNGAVVASASSRRLEIDTAFLENSTRALPVQSAYPSAANIRAHHFYDREIHGIGDDRRKYIYLLNNGFPINFMPGSQSVPDEIIQPVLGQIVTLMKALVDSENKDGINGSYHPGKIYGINRHQEKQCAQLWMQLRGEAL